MGEIRHQCILYFFMSLCHVLPSHQPSHIPSFILMFFSWCATVLPLHCPVPLWWLGNLCNSCSQVPRMCSMVSFFKLHLHMLTLFAKISWVTCWKHLTGFTTIYLLLLPLKCTGSKFSWMERYGGGSSLLVSGFPLITQTVSRWAFSQKTFFSSCLFCNFCLTNWMHH